MASTEKLKVTESLVFKLALFVFVLMLLAFVGPAAGRTDAAPLYAQAQTAQHPMGGSPNVTPGCVVSVPGHWNDTWLNAATFFSPGKELGGFTVSVNGVACAVQHVGPERLVFWMPVNATLGDYSASVNTPTGMKSVAMHVVEAAPTLHAYPNGIAGIYSPIAYPLMRSIGPDGVINLPQVGSSVLVTSLHQD